MRKKFVSILLIIMVLLTTFPMGIFAETTDNTPVTQATALESTVVGNEPSPVATEQVESMTASCVYNDTLQYWNAALTWTGTASSYNVWIDADDFASATIKNIVRGTSYTFNNVAIGSHTVYVSTTDGSSVKSQKIQVGLTLNAYASYKSVKLKWNAISGATGYVIKRSKVEDGEYTVVGTVEGAVTEYDDSVSSTTRLYYKVCPYVETEDNIIAESNVVYCGRVRIMTIKFTFAETRTLTSHTGGSVKHKFKKGYKATASGFADGKYHFKYDGRTYYVQRISTKDHKISSIDKKKNYSKVEAEYYVNKRGLKSNTKYLIWVNTYSQREYIFTGSKGKWKIKYSWEISTGKADTPTKVGVTKIKKKLYERHDLHYWNMCSQFSIHNKANNWKLGYPRSGGCVRNTTDHAKWIYDNCPLETAVCIY